MCKKTRRQYIYKEGQIVQEARWQVGEDTKSMPWQEGQNVEKVGRHFGKDFKHFKQKFIPHVPNM